MSRKLVLSDHARTEAARRGIDQTIVLAVAEAPEQVLPVRAGREVRQSRVPFPPEGRVYLVRVFVDADSDSETVVTVYRTSRINKYWRTR
ncbi:MAG: DUF4258 domain-containing protein [Gemmatimonadaceae bacterium]